MEYNVAIGAAAASLVLSAIVVAATPAQGAECRIVQQKNFPGDGEKVRLARPSELGPSANFGIFRAPLAVNTDGAPNSYHPMDPLGQTLAINRFDNGIAISATKGASLTTQKKLQVFASWRDNNWNVPTGFRISWKNVIAATPANKPCVFQNGENKGYFGSLTAARNGLSGAAAGECLVKDQLDQRFIPAIVLRGGNGNPLTGFGARVRDLVVAMNPETSVIVPAMIGDSGDGNRIGEGSVALNRMLLGRPNLPTNYKDAVQNFDTGNKAMIVAVLPSSRDFELVRPYTPDNLRARVTAWATANGYEGLEGLASAITLCANGL
jgi:hypothetical protein